jgi:RNA polymerase sigma factor (sigma-70 family)
LSNTLADIQYSNEDYGSKRESEVWGNLKRGDKNALAFFYTKYLKNLYNYGMKVCQDAGLTEDSIQDLFIGIWSSHSRLGDVTHVKSYLYKSLRTKILYKLSLQARTPLKDIDSFTFALSHTSHYLTQRVNSDVSEKIRQYIDTLTPKQKEAIFLIYYEELSYEEAAVVMDLRVKTVYNLIHLAISRLRQNRSKLSSAILFSLF